MTRERPKAITLTDRAAERVKAIMAAEPGKYVGLKVGVDNGGCAGMKYKMDYAESVEALDEVVEDKGVKILIDPKAILFLLGSVMDYEEGLYESGFKFDNPNETDACGCGAPVTRALLRGSGRTPQSVEQ